nr:hypothetical protein [Tanacetum cinerariifolium]
MEADSRPRQEPRNQSVALSPLTKTRLEHYSGAVVAVENVVEVEIFSEIVAHFADYFVAEEFVVEGVVAEAAVAVAEVVVVEAVAAEIVAEVVFAYVEVEAGMMDLFAFIYVADPTKVKTVKRERVEEEAKLLDSTIGRVVPLLP